MMYLFTGTDVEKVRRKAFEWVAAAQAKEPQVVYRRLAREDLSPVALEEAAQSGGLFVSRLLILVDDPFSTSRDEVDGEEAAPNNPLTEKLDMLVASDNVFLLLAPRLTSAKRTALEKVAKKVYAFDTVERVAERGFNTALVNALANRSSEKLWLEVVRALRAGDAPEMLHGLLHWKARDLMQKGSRAWSEREARELSLSLIELLQSSRRGGLELSYALERFALSV